MLETILLQSAAFARDAAATMQLLAGMAWSWLAAQPLWMTLGAATALKLAIVVAFIMRRRGERKVSVAPRPPAKTRPATAPVPASTATTGTRAALQLVSLGLPALEIARQTGLSRDAVSLLLIRAGDKAAGQGTPHTAGVSGHGSNPRRTGAGR
jgi:hypothetical protein